MNSEVYLGLAARGALRRIVRIRLAAFALATLVLDGRPADAGTNVWTTNGPDRAGQILSLAVNPIRPAIVYTGSAGGGVFKSIDGGTSWTAVNEGLDPGPDLLVVGLTIDPQHPATLYFGAAYGGVFKSTNAGRYWQSEGPYIGDYIQALAIDPAAPETLYAGTASHGVWSSPDAAVSWSAGDPDLLDITVLAVDPGEGTTIYAGTGDGLFKSTDSASAFVPVGSGLPRVRVYALVIAPTDRATLFIGTETGAFKSNDGAASFTPIDALPVSRVTALAVDPTTPSTLYAAGIDVGSVYKSTDGGTSWVPINAGLTDTRVLVLAFDPKRPATVYAGTADGGVFRIDQQATPTPTATGPLATQTPRGRSDSASLQSPNTWRACQLW